MHDGVSNYTHFTLKAPTATSTVILKVFLSVSHTCVFQTGWRVTGQKAPVRRMKMRMRNKRP